MVGGPLPLIRDPVALVRDLLALIRGLLAAIRHLLPRGADSCGRPRLLLLTTSLTVAAQPGTFTLQGLIVGLELRRPALELRADALDLDPCRVIALLEQAHLQLTQTAPVRFEYCRLTL